MGVGRGKVLMDKVTQSAKRFGSAISANGALTDSFDKRIMRAEDLSGIKEKMDHLGDMVKKGGEGVKKGGDYIGKKKKYTKAVNNFKEAYGGDASKAIKDMGDDISEKVSKGSKAFEKTKDGTIGEKWKAMSDSGLYKNTAHQAADTARNYFAGPNVNYTGEGYKNGLARVAAVGGTYAGANAIGRAVSGGSMTRNNKGERDIAGIPFI